MAGKDKGKKGAVVKICSNDRLIVKDINMVKRHKKPNPNLQEQGGIIEKEAPIQVSNVAIWNSETNKADRVGFVIDEDGNKKRLFKSNRKPVDL